MAIPRNLQRKNASWYQMAAKGKTVEISIYENIGANWWGDGLTAKRFERELKAFGEVEAITTRINSNGGSVFDGNAIYNILRSHKAPVHTIIDGVAASIASIIALAGDTIEMPENAMMMIHNPMNIIFGNAIEMRKMADDLDTIKQSILNVYVSRTGLDRDTVSGMMDRETWMTADEAVELGFADEMTKAVKAVASVSPEALAMFRNTPVHLLQAVPLNVTSEQNEEDDSMSAQPTAVTPPAGPTDAEIQAKINEAVNAALSPQMQQLNTERLNNVRMRFAGFVAEGKMTPAQSKLCATLAEQLMSVNAQIKWSTATDGTNEVTGSPVDALIALAETMNHSLLTEQVAAGDKGAGEATQAATTAEGTAVAVSAKNWKPDMSKLPSEQSGCPSGYIMDQFIREVVMKANPQMKYAEAANLAEKDPDLQALLNQNDYIPAN